jgi:gliding motility-associated protein GldL
MAGSSKRTDRILNVIVCLGAAVVIVGAWMKITTQPLANLMLTIGLLTEAFIFICYAIVPPHEDPMASVAEALPKMISGAQAGGNPALDKMDKMLQEADITPANLTKLSDSFKKLGTTVEKISDVGDVLKSTSDYSAKTKEATQALDTLKTSYQGAANTIGQFNQAADSTKQFHEQVQVLSKNLGSLNAIYELELQDTNNHLKAMNSFYGNLVQASQAMQTSVDDAKQAHEQIAKLAKNLTSLNTVYGNMLNAMQGRS